MALLPFEKPPPAVPMPGFQEQRAARAGRAAGARTFQRGVTWGLVGGLLWALYRSATLGFYPVDEIVVMTGLLVVLCIGVAHFKDAWKW